MSRDGDELLGRGDPAGKPLVEWRRTGCRCWLLRAWRTPRRSWVVRGRPMRAAPRQWAEMAELNPALIDDHYAGQAYIANLREVRPLRYDGLPADPNDWTIAERFPIGCDHWSGDGLAEWVRADVRAHSTTRGGVKRLI